MVVKTETCFYSELRIYPGHGRRVVRRDGKLLIFINSRCRFQWENRKKAMRLRWTQSWRRANKKAKVDKTERKKLVKKTTKVFKAFSGIAIEDLKARRAVGSDFKKSQKDSAERKEKAKKANGDKKSQPKANVFVKVPKQTRMRSVNATSK